MPLVLSREEADKIITALTTFAVTFTKKNGEIRHMRCEKGTDNYRSKLKGGKSAYDHKDKMLVPVLDADLGEIRSVPLNRLEVLRIGADTKDPTTLVSFEIIHPEEEEKK
jgi:hypothetical protein